MNRLLALLAALGLLTGCATGPRSGHWRALFDGHDVSAWRTYQGTGFPTTGWKVEDGCLHLHAGGQGGELVTVDTFDNFELEWEWRIAPKANNGIKYFVTESRPGVPGPEYQMVDDSTMPDPRHKTATFYEVLALPGKTSTHAPGEWNKSRLVVQGNHVEHWLNDVKVLAYEMGSEEVKAGIAKSKFKHTPGFDQKIRGHILLTNHHDEAWYRSIRIRELP